MISLLFIYFCCNATATTEHYTLSLHDALPIFTMTERPTGCTVILTEAGAVAGVDVRGSAPGTMETDLHRSPQDRKSTRLNSSHLGISYAVFCLKKKKKNFETDNRSLTITLIMI